MTTVVCWLWGNKYSERHVRVLQAMVARNLSAAHRFVCITDRREIDGVDCISMPPRPLGATAESIRLWLFSQQARKALGPDIFNLDIDVVITGPIDELVSDPAPFRIWKSDSTGMHRYALNPTVMLVRGSAMQGVWDKFKSDSAAVLRRSRRAGWTGTEQAVIAEHFHRAPALPPMWTNEHGIHSMRTILSRLPEHVPPDRIRLPAGARIVSFHGKREPADFLEVDWVRSTWRC